MVTYADRPWTKNYHPNTPKTLTYPKIALHDFLRQTAQRIPNSPALVTSARLPLVGRVAQNLTFAELDQQSDALAAALVEMGLKKGDRVVLLMPNCAAFVVGFYAALKAGGVIAAANPTYPADMLKNQLNDCGAEFVISLSLFYKLAKSVQTGTKVKHVIVTNVKEYLPPLAKVLFGLAREKKDGHYVESLAEGDKWLPDLLKQYAGRKPNVTVTPEDVCLFQYTGGTTGVSKAAVATHAALVANVLQQEAFLSVDGIPGEKEIFLGAIPFFHVFGMVAVLSMAIKTGARIIVVPNARDIADVIDCIHKFQPTLFHGVPALYNAINNHPKVKAGEISLKSIRACISGSAPLPPATKQEFERLSGGRLLEGFGMSEAPTASHVNPLNGTDHPGSIGLPLPDMDMRIVSLDDGETDLPIGEAGELLMSGPQLMVGYHNMPDETARVMREHNGKLWLYTGDIAKMDEEGYFYIVDRKKDMALIGGFNVYPNNVEKALKDHPAVLEVGVAAIPHPDRPGQEALKAWVVLQPEAQATEQELIEFAAKTLPPYSVPRRIAFIKELPKSAVGKTLRRELVRMEMEGSKQ
ncbi:MAG: long-chain fatty acid--CoA ligase [Anaerolineae bacterium]|jgi:long-chain acyl-CoA synthetase|nr:long-chain fatty acid--CoA ligase [Anaerolineae bacterium]